MAKLTEKLGLRIDTRRFLRQLAEARRRYAAHPPEPIELEAQQPRLPSRRSRSPDATPREPDTDT
ncbi:MAG: hypothetical protein ACLF0G_03070 [Candidatus Brocadiia bacterium]